MNQLITDQLCTDQLCTDQLCTYQLSTDQFCIDRFSIDQLCTDQLSTDQLCIDQHGTDLLSQIVKNSSDRKSSIHRTAQIPEQLQIDRQEKIRSQTTHIQIRGLSNGYFFVTNARQEVINTTLER
ncbi:alpha/beta hydrolase domain-containing protein 17C-like [Dorcoceras hygrometricum]|uniref:Alpha/beta hydrolase domain-containing protein 17C-like n=1 Tax=Dorcoceras hygrometricum TaxID=472368 RepID=A0A2Z7ACF8_9LAMI|nr:alpha/beta hydrolase domain-containing protein 17C-like [Dorcoceras hygrometricum]